MDKKIYKCICGREFANSQALNSHKSQCKEHFLQKYGDLAEYEKHQTTRHKAAQESFQKKAEAKKLEAQSLWLAEQHVCERCGKIMVEKFGSGRFCSRACANARDHSEATKEKISQALIKPEELKVKRVIPKVEPKSKSLRVKKQPDCCVVCRKMLGEHHSTPYCTTHLKEHKQELKLQHWLEAGETGLAADTTIRGIYREYIMEQQKHCCAICGMPDEWNGKPLVFVLDHINGDAAYSARENLRLICPNCDSQLDTFKSKNKNSARTKRKEFLREIREEDK